jgi:hypothetical protein
MAVREFIEALPHEEEPAASRWDLTSEFRAPSLAPTGMPSSRDTVARVPLGQLDLSPVIRDEAPEQSDLLEWKTSFVPRRTLIGSAVIVVALGMSAWFFWPSASEKTPMQTAEPAATTQASAVASVEVVSSMPDPSPAITAATASADVSPSVSAAGPADPVQAFPQAVAAGPTENTAEPQAVAAAPIAATTEPQTVPSPQNRDLVYLQRPGVNIRSTPSLNGPVVGTAPKGKRFRATDREGDWVEVESGRLKGWIDSQFLGPNAPR